MSRRLLRSFSHAVRGIGFVWKEEANFRVLVWCAIAVLLVTIALDFTLLETALIVFTILLVLGSEMLNTLIEELLNKVEPKHDPIVGKLKDIMAGMVLINSIGAGVIGVLVVVSHWKL